MFPILWRSYLKAYLKTFLVTLSTFVALLLISRFKELARFAALSSSGAKTALFTLYQFPWILPIAIPLSALLSSFLLMQQLSRTQELTAFRSLGVSVCSLLTPLLVGAGFLCVANGWIVGDISPHCRQKTRQILYHETTSNPLLLLQRQRLVKIKDTFLRLEVEDAGKTAKNFLFITPTDSTKKLTLLSCNELWLEQNELHGKNFSIVSFLPQLIIENQRFMTTEAPLLSTSLKKHRPKIDPGSLNFRMLKIRIQENNRLSNAAIIELFRRISLTIAPFTFTWLGASFGMELGRRRKIQPLITATLLVVLVLVSYFLGRNLKASPLISMCVFFAPHLFLAWFSIRRINFFSKGRA